jgi:dienelactone hydrolase
MRLIFIVFGALVGAPLLADVQSVPTAIFTDPPADHAHPAAMKVLHIPSHGVLINGLVYSPGGAGPHPTLVICHGLPGNEKNLDLAQAVRRAGWNAVTFNYRGSWEVPGCSDSDRTWMMPPRFSRTYESLRTRRRWALTRSA